MAQPALVCAAHDAVDTDDLQMAGTRCRCANYAGTLLAQKLLNDRLDSIFAYDHRMTVSWPDPQVA